MTFNPKVLIVDDAQMIRSALKITLIEAGVTGIAEAKNGREALEIMENEKFDLIICDWEMPEMSGIETLRHVRKDPRYKDTPFVMVTSVAEPENIREAVKEGVTDYIVKPVKPDLFLGKISFILQKLKNARRKNVRPLEIKEWVIT